MFEQLADVFSFAAFKYLSVVDADPKSSHQHEIGGLVKAGIGQELGMPDDGSQLTIRATMVYLSESYDEPLVSEDIVTWYDARYHKEDRGAEWRLYYKSNDVSNCFKPGDFFLIALTREGSLLMIFCPPQSDFELQIRSLFGARSVKANKKGLTRLKVGMGLAVPIRVMLSRYGIELDDNENKNKYLDSILDQFGATFPKTKDFSILARKLAGKICPVEQPDEALIEWMTVEEAAFRQLERHIVKAKLADGFGEKGDDVDEFVRFSLSVQNRRKSRSGHAFENHIEFILKKSGLHFKRGGLTEKNQKPDFIFPSSTCYADEKFPSDKLRILGAKTTCKDRWRQVLAEAARVDRKHLITMEPAISENQTEQMQANNLQLVVPTSIQQTYTPEQRLQLMSFRDFINEVKSCQ
ncbi:restriction endonuclease [Aeromonas veronii]|uniref:type II restriction endonuclease n=1 Tax=Aeromonas veronii TaxID=654 RepID=UPI001430BE9E|nr:type II restriction endonuclease [Aeromonas veronii]NJI24866.1 restriction endonuclease [Aeromonas veronii]NJI35146.1 restriction endonuclease [Aeromonas veronii]